MEFKQVWENKISGDKVFLDEERALVKLQMGPTCGSHEKDVYCPYCLPRLVEALDFVRTILDATAPTKVSERADNHAGAEYMAFHNPISKENFTLRFHSSIKVSGLKSLFTGKVIREPLDTVTLLEYKTQTKASDVDHVASFFIRLKEGGSQEYLRKLWDSKLTISVDGEALVSQMKLKEAIGKKEITLGPSEQSYLFDAQGVDGEWCGYMLPNGTTIKIVLDQIPSGGGLIQIESGWDATIYTSKEA